MATAGGSDRFPFCTKALTALCPYLNEPAMKRVLGDSSDWLVEGGRQMDMLSIVDYQGISDICRDCSSFSPEQRA